MAIRDRHIAERLADKNKTLDGCVTYIISQVQKSGCNGFTDDEIYSMAVHYYIEEELEPGHPVDCQVIVNHQVQLTEEEIAEMKQKAKDRCFSDEMSRLRSGPRTLVRKRPAEEDTGSLFTLD